MAPELEAGETVDPWKAAHDAHQEHTRLVYAKAARAVCDAAWAEYTRLLRIAEADQSGGSRP